jgi:Uma2 family endonuclease
VEIVSPEQSVNSLVRRCLWYVDNGVRIALLVDPEDESVIVFRPGSEPTVRRAADQIELGDVLPGFQLRAEELFDSLSL